MIETQLEMRQRRGKMSAIAFWVILLAGGVVFAVTFLNYLNKLLLVTYEVQGMYQGNKWEGLLCSISV